MSLLASFPPFRWFRARLGSRLGRIVRTQLEAVRVETSADREQSLSSLRVQIKQSVEGAQAALQDRISGLERRISRREQTERLTHRLEALIAGLAADSEDVREGMGRHLEDIHRAVLASGEPIGQRLDALTSAADRSREEAARDRERIERLSRDLAADSEDVREGMGRHLEDIRRAVLASGEPIGQRLDALTSAADQSREDAARDRERIERLSRDLAEMSERLAATPQRVHAVLGAPLANIIAGGLELQDRVGELGGQAARSQTRIEELEADIPRRVIEALEQPIASIAGQAADLQARMGRLTDQADAARERIDQLQSEAPHVVLEGVGGSIADIQGKVAELAARSAAAAARLEEIALRTDGLLADIRGASVQVESVNGQFPRLAEQLGTRLIRLSELVSQLGAQSPPAARNGAARDMN